MLADEEEKVVEVVVGLVGRLLFEGSEPMRMPTL